MAISGPNVIPKQEKVSDWEKGMQLGAQLAQGFQALAAHRQQQARDSWAVTKDLISIAGDDILGGDTAAAEKLKPLIRKSLSRLSGRSESDVGKELDDFFNNIEPNFKQKLEAAGQGYVFEGNYPGQAQQTQPTQPNVTQQNMSATTTTQPTQGSDTYTQYTTYEPEVVEAFSRFGIGTGASTGGKLEPEREKAIRERLKESGADQGKINFVIDQYKANGYIPRTRDPVEMKRESSEAAVSRPGFASDVALNIEGLGEVRKGTKDGKSSYTFIPMVSVTGGRERVTKSTIKRLVEASGGQTKGEMGKVDLGRYFRMIAEENIPQMAKMMGTDETKLRAKYKARPQELDADFNSLSTQMNEISLPVKPGSVEYSFMFTPGVSEQKAKEIKGAVDEMQSTLDKIGAGELVGEAAVSATVGAVDSYTSKLVRTKDRVAHDPAYMRSVFGRIAGGDPTNIKNEDVLAGVTATMDMLMNSPTRQQRIAQETALSTDADVNAKLSDMGIKYAQLQLEMQKFDWGKQMDQATLQRLLGESQMMALQKQISEERQDRSTTENMIVNIDKQLNDEKLFTKGWQNDPEKTAKLYRDSKQFRELYDRRMGLLSSMYGQPVTQKGVGAKKGWGWIWDEQELVNLPYVDTSAGLPPTVTEQKLYGMTVGPTPQQQQQQAAQQQQQFSESGPSANAQNLLTNKYSKQPQPTHKPGPFNK